MDIIKSIYRWGRISENQIAVCYKDECVTYGELIKRINGISKRIIEKKRIGDDSIPIVILGERGVNFIAAMLGTMQSGNFYVPIEMPILQARLVKILEQLDNYILVTTRNYEILSELNVRYCINLEECEQIDNIECYGMGLNQEDICYMIFTSGTTGIPKGVLIRYESLCNLVGGFLGLIYNKMENPVCVGVMSSFSFDASVKQIFGALCYGHCLAIAQKEDKMFSLRMQSFFTKNKIRIIDGTPSVYKLLMRKERREDWRISYFLIGGEVMKHDFLETLMKYLGYEGTIINVYGPTECCVDASYHIVNSETTCWKNEIVPIGKPIVNANFHLHDLLGNDIEEDGIEGELYISGVLVADGYFKQQVSDRFIYDKLGRTYKTGDWAVRNKEGDYTVLGRIDEQIKVNGNRIELYEVEHAISEIILSEVAVCLRNEPMEDALYAFSVGDGKHISEKSILHELTKRLPTYGIPKKIVFINESFPITENGKVDRKKLMDKYLY